MPTTAKSTVKTWFQNGDKPNQEQFWAWMDSWWHKDELIPQSAIEGLEDDLATAFSTVVLENPGQVDFGPNVLLELIVVESADDQVVTIETTPTAANIAEDDEITAGGNNVYRVDIWTASGMSVYFRSFTEPITIRLFKRG